MTSSKRALVLAIVTPYVVGCERPEAEIDAASVERVITTLSADEMLGRAPFTPAIDKAARAKFVFIIFLHSFVIIALYEFNVLFLNS